MASVRDAMWPALEEVRIVGLREFYGPNRIDDVAQLEDGMPAALRHGAESRATSGAESVVAELRSLPVRLRPLVDLAVGGCGWTAVLRAFARRERADAEVLRVL